MVVKACWVWDITVAILGVTLTLVREALQAQALVSRIGLSLSGPPTPTQALSCQGLHVCCPQHGTFHPPLNVWPAPAPQSLCLSVTFSGKSFPIPSNTANISSHRLGLPRNESTQCFIHCLTSVPPPFLDSKLREGRHPVSYLPLNTQLLAQCSAQGSYSKFRK